MSWHDLPRLEGLLMAAILIGLLVWQLVSVKRDIRRDREAKRKDRE